MTKWIDLRLADACESIDYGLTASASNARTGPRFLRITDIVTGHVDWGLVPFVEASEASRFKLADGDIVVARTGASTGASVYIKDPPDAAFASYLVRLRVRPEFDARFIAYYLKSRFFLDYIRAVLGDKSAQPNASASTMGRAPLRVPASGVEQHRIGRVLAAFDDKIALNRRSAKVLEEIPRRVFRSWFVQRATTTAPLSVLASQSRHSVDPGSRPEDVFDLFSIPAFDNDRRPERRTGKEIKSSKLLVPGGSVLISKLNPRIPRVWWPTPAEGRTSVCSTEFVVLVPNAGISREFLYALTSDPAFSRQLEAGVTGTSGSHQRVKPDAVLATEVSIPGPDEMRRFTDAVAPMYARANVARQECEALASLRDTLLPKLVSGELRIAS